MIQVYTAMELKPQYIAAPFCSMMHDLAMEAGRDPTRTANTFPGAFDTPASRRRRVRTAIDSLAAVKHLIYDTKKLTWDQLLEALEANWEGHEADPADVPERAQVWKRHRVGGRDRVSRSSARVMEYLHKHPKPQACFQLRVIPITFHVPSGMVTLATPNGRPAGEFLSEGISPSHGMDTEGAHGDAESMARAQPAKSTRSTGRPDQHENRPRPTWPARRGPAG